MYTGPNPPRFDTLAEHVANAKIIGVDHGWEKISCQYEPGCEPTVLTEPWQLALFDKAWNKPSIIRNMTWIYDTVGGAGKTKFVRYCDENLGESVVELNFSHSRIHQFAFLKHRQCDGGWTESDKHPTRTVLVDISRSQYCLLTKKQIKTSLDILSDIGSHYNARVIIFANSSPPPSLRIINLCEIKDGQITSVTKS
jgi:hypothetical protein